jgi:hypothetical protein
MWHAIPERLQGAEVGQGVGQKETGLQHTPRDDRLGRRAEPCEHPLTDPAIAVDVVDEGPDDRLMVAAKLVKRFERVELREDVGRREPVTTLGEVVEPGAVQPAVARPDLDDTPEELGVGCGDRVGAGGVGE